MSLERFDYEPGRQLLIQHDKSCLDHRELPPDMIEKPLMEWLWNNRHVLVACAMLIQDGVTEHSVHNLNDGLALRDKLRGEHTFEDIKAMLRWLQSHRDALLQAASDVPILQARIKQLEQP